MSRNGRPAPSLALHNYHQDLLLFIHLELTCISHHWLTIMNNIAEWCQLVEGQSGSGCSPSSEPSSGDRATDTDRRQFVTRIHFAAAYSDIKRVYSSTPDYGQKAPVASSGFLASKREPYKRCHACFLNEVVKGGRMYDSDLPNLAFEYGEYPKAFR